MTMRWILLVCLLILTISLIKVNLSVDSYRQEIIAGVLVSDAQLHVLDSTLFNPLGIVSKEIRRQTKDSDWRELENPKLTSDLEKQRDLALHLMTYREAILGGMNDVRYTATYKGDEYILWMRFSLAACSLGIILILIDIFKTHVPSQGKKIIK